MQHAAEDLRHFRRIYVNEPVDPVHDLVHANARLLADNKDPAANTFLGLHLLQVVEVEGFSSSALRRAKQHLETAVASGHIEIC